MLMGFTACCAWLQRLSDNDECGEQFPRDCLSKNGRVPVELKRHARAVISFMHRNIISPEATNCEFPPNSGDESIKRPWMRDHPCLRCVKCGTSVRYSLKHNGLFGDRLF